LGDKDKLSASNWKKEDIQMKLTTAYVTEFSCAVLCGALAFTSSSLAAPQNPCTKDIGLYCKDAKPEKDGILKCLESHTKQLSKACRDYEGTLDGANGGPGNTQDAKSKKTKFPYVYR
jgi:hypothetical protein